MADVKGYKMPDDLFYHKDFSWVRFEEGDIVRVGLLDFAQAEALDRRAQTDGEGRKDREMLHESVVLPVILRSRSQASIWCPSGKRADSLPRRRRFRRRVKGKATEFLMRCRPVRIGRLGRHCGIRPG